MKNIHVIPTSNPTRLYYNNGVLHLDKYFYTSNGITVNQNLYITNSDEIKQGDYYIFNNIVLKALHNNPNNINTPKVILTTDITLINDGIQSISDEFLDWFVKNPSYESVEIGKYHQRGYISGKWFYQIIIPKEKPNQEDENYLDSFGVTKSEFETFRKFNKQETIEDVAEEYARKQCDDMYDDEAPTGGSWGWETKTDFIAGAKWQANKMYSEEDMLNFAMFLEINLPVKPRRTHKQLLEQFKKK
jgi:hypothetical protein